MGGKGEAITKKNTKGSQTKEGIGLRKKVSKQTLPGRRRNNKRKENHKQRPRQKRREKKREPIRERFWRFCAKKV